jgi:hypothetical protein
MTRNRQRKARIRARQQATGERYNRLLATPITTGARSGNCWSRPRGACARPR